MRSDLFVFAAFVGALLTAVVRTPAGANASPPPCPGDSVVWVNPAMQTYRLAGESLYGINGPGGSTYMCLAAAEAAADIEYAPNIGAITTKAPLTVPAGRFTYSPFRLVPAGVYILASCYPFGGPNPSCGGDSSGGFVCSNGVSGAQNYLQIFPYAPQNPPAITRLSAINVSSLPSGNAAALHCSLTLLDATGAKVFYTLSAPAQGGH